MIGTVFTYKAEFANGLTEHEIDHVYIARCDKEPKPNPKEAESYKWICVPDLQKDMEKQPELFTPWLKPALELALKVYVFS